MSELTSKDIEYHLETCRRLEASRALYVQLPRADAEELLTAYSERAEEIEALSKSLNDMNALALARKAALDQLRAEVSQLHVNLEQLYLGVRGG